MMKPYETESSPPTPSSQDLEPKFTTAMERDAELTLLSLTLKMNQEEVDNFLDEHNITHIEYISLTRKWSRVLESYKLNNTEEISK